MQGSHLGAALAVMTSAGALLGGAGLAEAAPLTFALDTDLITSKNLTFPQFNPSLGTLNAVDITLSSSATAGTATAGLTGGEGSVTASLSGLLKVTGPGAVTAFSRPTSVSATCVVLPKPAEPEPIGLVYHPWRACHPPGGCHEPVTDGAL